MKGWADLVTMTLMTVLIGLIVIAIFAPTIKGESINPYPAQEINLQETCNSDTECEKNYNGSICITTYPDYYLPFCGCITNDDCQSGLVERSGVCLSNHRCKFPY